MYEMDQHGGISPSHLVNGSEKQQQSYHSKSEDIASLQDKWPSFDQAAPQALEIPASEIKTENVSENVKNGKGGLESADASKLSDEAVNQQNCGQAAQRHESVGNSSKRRHNRWDLVPEEGGVANEGECSGKKKRSRWDTDEPKISTPGVANEVECSGDKRSTWGDPEVQELCKKLFDINTKLQTGNVSARKDTKEGRARKKLMEDKQMTIARLIEINPAFRPPADSKPVKQHSPPADSKPVKQHKKLYIPVKEYPGYNFIGLILGPRGITVKRMEKETGAKICIRGRGHRQDLKPDPSDNEDLHVLIEADNEYSLEEACGMVEKLLVPVEDGRNEHKRAQLRELARIKGTLDHHILCGFCGQIGHKQVDCPKKINCQNNVSLQAAKVNTTDDHDLCFELGTGKSAVSVEKSGPVPRQSILPLGPTDNYMPWLAQAGGLKHPQNGNAGIGTEVTRVSMEKRGSELPIKSSQPLGFTDNYMSWLARGLEHLENGNAGLVPGYVSVEKSGSGLPRQSTQPLGLTDPYMSWLAGGLEHPENVNPGIGAGKVSVEKSGAGLLRQSTQPLGLTDPYMSWLAGGLEHPENANPGVGPVIRKLSIEKSGSHFEHNHGKKIDHSNVYVGYLPTTMEEGQLIKLFSSFGRIVEASVIRDRVKGSSEGYGFVKFYDIHSAAQAIEHMNGYMLEGKALVVRVAGVPSHSQVGHAEGLYTFDKQKPPRLPVHSGDYAQPSWNTPTRPVSSAPYNPYSDNSGCGMPSDSVSSLQGATFNSLPATSYCTYGLYQLPFPSAESSSGMQGPPRFQQVPGNAHDSVMPKLNAHLPDAMSHFSPNKASIPTYQRYAPPSIPSGSAYSESSSRGSLMGGLCTPPWSSSLFSSGYEKKAVEFEYNKFLSEMGPRHENISRIDNTLF